MSDPEKTQRIMDYLEKKKSNEEKEKYFMDEIEKATKLLEEHEYDGAVKSYMDLIPVAEDLKWTDKVKYLKDLVYEAREKEKEYNVKEKQKKVYQDKKLHDKALYNNALDLMDRGQQSYKEKDYGASIGHYEESLKLLKEINASREIQAVNDTLVNIRKEYDLANQREAAKNKKEEEDKKTAERKERELKYKKELMDREKQAEMNRLKSIQEKKEKKQKTIDDAMACLDDANLELKEAKSMDFVSVDAKKSHYDKAIEFYEEAADLFKQIEWSDEADKVKDTIFNIKKERDKGLELLRKKLEKKQDKASIATAPITKAELEQIEKDKGKDKEASELVQKKLKMKEKRDEALAALEEAGDALDKFEKKPKIIGGQLFKENKYPEIIRLYRKALELFKQIDWINEAAKIEDSIKILEQKEENFLAEKEVFEKHQEGRVSATDQISKDVEYRANVAAKSGIRSTRIQGQRDARRKQAREIRDEIDNILGKAMSSYKKREYMKSEQEYQKAYDLMVKNGWAQEAENVKDTIAMIREKREQLDKKLLKKERDVEDVGQFTQGVEEISDTMGIVKEQEKLAADEQKAKLLEQRAMQKQKEEDLIEMLGEAQSLMNQKNFDAAVLKYRDALEIAQFLKWTSQIRDIRDFINDAKAKRDAQAKIIEKKQKNVQEQEEISRRIRGIGDSVAGKQVDAEKVSSMKKEEKEISDAAYAFLDEGNKLLREGKQRDAVESFKQAMKKFEKIEWNRERDAVVLQIQKVEKEMQEEEVKTSKQKEEEKTKLAYDAINDAEKCLRSHAPEKAVGCYEKAIEIFDSVNWTKEATMVRQQMEKVKEDVEKSKVVQKESSDKEKLDKAFMLIDEAKKYQRNRKIFKAVELAHDALDIFKSLGSEWQREINQVTQFVKELDREKQRKEELIKKLKMGEL